MRLEVIEGEHQPENMVEKGGLLDAVKRKCCRRDMARAVWWVLFTEAISR
jgi:hypothetical protein